MDAPHARSRPHAVVGGRTERAARPLIVLMHGWSYDERHPFGIAHRFPSEMVMASVRAPYAEAGGYAWFPSQGNPIGDPQPSVANDSIDAVMDWLGTLPSASSTGLLGFSQGGAMVLQLMRDTVIPRRAIARAQSWMAAHTPRNRSCTAGWGTTWPGPR